MILLLTLFVAVNDLNQFNDKANPIRVNPLNDVTDGFQVHSNLSKLAERSSSINLFSKIRFSPVTVLL